MEEANNTVTTETSIPSDTASDVKPEPETMHSYSQEEYDKAIKSAASKAKGDILKELGITSVKDFAILKESYEKSISDTEALRKTNEELSNKLVLKSLNVRDDNADDFISLASKRITDGKGFEQAAKEVAEAYPNMLNSPNMPKIGTEKAESEPKKEMYSARMLEKYPFLKKKK